MAGIPIYKCIRGTAFAKGYPTPEGFTVLKGSIVSSKIGESFELSNRWNYALRLKLVAEGIIKDRVFQQDYQFKSASAAASVVMGLGISGHVAWQETKEVLDYDV